MLFLLKLKPLVKNGRVEYSRVNFLISRSFYGSSEKMSSCERIGPHNIDIISIIIGSLMGDTHLEKRINGIGTRVKYLQSNKNVEYLMWFHSYFSNRGYCSLQIPKLHKRIKRYGEVFFHYRINSYTFSSLNWMHDMFYTLLENKYVKTIPYNIEEFMTPLCLAIWFMNDGSKLGSGARIAINCFTYKEILFLCEMLNKKFNLSTTLHTRGKNKGHVIYIPKSSMTMFSNLVKPLMLPSLYYKLGNY
jgi:ubiquinol-cytochrome c reductase cytochrome b subunit